MWTRLYALSARKSLLGCESGIFFLYFGGVFLFVKMSSEDVVKPSCYDSVPACLCMDCQLYDVKKMVRVKSTAVSSRSPFLPSYAASLLSRPSCSVATSTSGLAVTDVAKPVYEPACESDCFPRRPFLSRPRLDFAVSSSPCFLPAKSSGSVANRPVTFVTASHGSPVCSVAASPAAMFGPAAAPCRLLPSLPVSKPVFRPVLRSRLGARVAVDPSFP